MDAKELRIGNWVKNPVSEQEIIYMTADAVGFDPIREAPRMAHPFEYCTAIPLTEEWLEKFEQLNEWFLELVQCQKGYQIHMKKNAFYITKIYSVHQLQNLYFALTGKELELKT